MQKNIYFCQKKFGKAVQHKSKFKIFQAKKLVNFIKIIFIKLGLNYPSNLEKIKNTKDIKYSQVSQLLSQQQVKIFFEGI